MLSANWGRERSLKREGKSGENKERERKRTVWQVCVLQLRGQTIEMLKAFYTSLR